MRLRQALRLEGVDGQGRVVNADLAGHAIEHPQVIDAALELEEGVRVRERSRWDSEGILRRLTDGHRVALAQQALLDELLVLDDPDAEDLAVPAFRHFERPFGSRRSSPMPIHTPRSLPTLNRVPPTDRVDLTERAHLTDRWPRKESTTAVTDLRP